MGWFNKKYIEELQDMQEAIESMKGQLETANKSLSELNDQINQKDLINNELKRELDKRQYANLYLLSSGQQGDLFIKLLRNQKNLGLNLENLSCSGMYLSDRNSMVYEIVNTIYIRDVSIKNSHFENACFDTIVFKNIDFDKDSFYNAWFDDVKFIDCSFKNCDFTLARGYNISFENCKVENTDISKIEIYKEHENISEEETSLLGDLDSYDDSQDHSEI